LWREAGLRVLAKQRKRRRISSEGENSCTLRRSEYKDHVWSYDFVMDQTEDGRRLKMMPVVDEYTRESLSIEVKRSITAKEVVKTLSTLFAQRGEPAFIRSGLRSRVHCQSCKAVALEVSGVQTLYIEPGSPSGRTPTRRRSSAVWETSY